MYLGKGNNRQDDAARPPRLIGRAGALRHLFTRVIGQRIDCVICLQGVIGQATALDAGLVKVYYIMDYVS